MEFRSYLKKTKKQKSSNLDTSDMRSQFLDDDLVQEMQTATYKKPVAKSKTIPILNSIRSKIKPQPKVAPPVPKELADLGLNPIFMLGILIKTMFRSNLQTNKDISKVLCVNNVICDDLIQIGRQQNLIETLGKSNISDTENIMRYQLTDSGKQYAIDALQQSEYYGALPVSLQEFKKQAKIQSIAGMAINKKQLSDNMQGLVIHDGLLDKLGPAVNSSKSILLYGESGNGKSSLADRIRNVIGDNIYIPQFLEYQSHVISMYDPIVHEKVKSKKDKKTNLLRTFQATYDQRYVYCRRPSVLTGGELKLDMLDLNYNPISKTYQAPLQLKSTGGLFIVDDLGRQAESPQMIINRWITPMEGSEDILALNSGEKFMVPFDTLVIFSTNFHPKEIFDDAALRRINFKILIEPPNQKQLLKILSIVAKSKNLYLPEEFAEHLFIEKYPSVNNVFAAYQPKFLIEQIIAICQYEDCKPELTTDLLNRAWENLFVKGDILKR